MREIEFRAYCPETKYMAYQGNADLETIQSFMFHWGDKILMQYTGLKDKNGKKIYEGDIIEHVPRFETRYKIKFLTSGFYICPLGKNFGHYFASLFAGHDEKTNSCESLEVIGNIFENPEFLNE